LQVRVVIGTKNLEKAAQKGITLLLIRFNSGFFEACELRGSGAASLPHLQKRAPGHVLSKQRRSL
jgi:hypothetical protein